MDNDVDMKMDEFNQNALLMSPPASDSGSPAGFSPYSIDSEPGSPLLDDAKVANIPKTICTGKHRQDPIGVTCMLIQMEICHLLPIKLR